MYNVYSSQTSLFCLSLSKPNKMHQPSKAMLMFSISLYITIFWHNHSSHLLQLFLPDINTELINMFYLRKVKWKVRFSLTIRFSSSLQVTELCLVVSPIETSHMEIAWLNCIGFTTKSLFLVYWNWYILLNNCPILTLTKIYFSLP